MKFSKLPYTRPDMEEFQGEFSHIFEQLKSDSLIKLMENLDKADQLRSRFYTKESLASIHYTQDSSNKSFCAEKEFFDKSTPQMEEWETQLASLLLKSDQRKALEERLGPQFFRLAEMKIQSFSSEIVPQVQEENRLSSEYVKLMASASIEFQGEKRNLSQLTPFEESRDRNIRKEALEARFSFFQENGEDLDRIYHELVKVRHHMAQKLGYDNFIPLGYKRMMRSDYGPAEVATFRASVYKHLVPLADKLYQRQWKRLGLEKGMYWDKPFRFPSGNAKPKGDKDWMVAQASRMYQELSPETHAFFTFMKKAELLDLEARKNKAGGGYCTALPDYKMPFIFSNFNGTSRDVGVLTHEAGHAFQVYSSFDLKPMDYLWPTYEACEVHSMSMDFFTWPWMDLFFEADAEKYRYAHLSDALQFIPYGVTVDEFQHLVYQNPLASPADRHRLWKQTEKKYNPWIDYGGIDYLEKGGFWQRQSHIYQNPFYYIDYTLAQSCALQYWHWINQNREQAWQSYLKLCSQGGKDSFVGLITQAGLKTPFQHDLLGDIIVDCENWLNSIDDSQF
ncbi:MAG: M3 family oligoendopeptidase [Spirochaetaceae bacterium]|jgi:M3 family oligoendopeptidase|nr:M3 family oligoendopeptidase [Spirochaetaceae bacterium]